MNILKKTHIQLILLIILTSCGNKFNQDIIDNLDQYKIAKEVLLNNIENIKTVVGFKEYDSINKIHYSTITNSNRYFFKNTIAINNTELKQILKYWDNEFIYNHDVYGTLTINKDRVIIFTTDYDDGLFSGVGHYIVYNPTNDNRIFDSYGNKILEIKKLNNNWFYIIQRRNYVD